MKTIESEKNGKKEVTEKTTDVKNSLVASSFINAVNEGSRQPRYRVRSGKKNKKDRSYFFVPCGGW